MNFFTSLILGSEFRIRGQTSDLVFKERAGIHTVVECLVPDRNSDQISAIVVCDANIEKQKQYAEEIRNDNFSLGVDNAEAFSVPEFFLPPVPSTADDFPSGGISVICNGLIAATSSYTGATVVLDLDSEFDQISEDDQVSEELVRVYKNCVSGINDNVSVNSKDTDVARPMIIRITDLIQGIMFRFSRTK